jgi:hypothetical protein
MKSHAADLISCKFLHCQSCPQTCSGVILKYTIDWKHLNWAQDLGAHILRGFGEIDCTCTYLGFPVILKPVISLSEQDEKFVSFQQVESLSGQLLNQEQELQRFSQQLQNAIAMATEEAVKSRAAKEVIKSLTAQVQTLHVDCI